MDSVPVPVPAVTGARLLLVDDNPKLCRMVKEYLEPLGYDVSLAHSGPEGLVLGVVEAVVALHGSPFGRAMVIRGAPVPQSSPK